MAFINNVSEAEKLERVGHLDIENKKAALTKQYEESGYPINEMTQQNIQDQVWNQYVEETVLEDEYEEIGLMVTTKELNDMLFGNNPPQDLKQQFTNPQTGQYDVNALKSAIQNLKKATDNPQAKSFKELYLPALVNNRLKEKYTALLANSMYLPKWMLEKMATDNNSIASISYVNVPYTSISDSAIKVSDDEIEEFLSTRKNEYKQLESRSISYVIFDAAPNAADSQAVYTQVANLKKRIRYHVRRACLPGKKWLGNALLRRLCAEIKNAGA